MDTTNRINVENHNGLIDRIAIGPKSNLSTDPLKGMRAVDLAQTIAQILWRERLLAQAQLDVTAGQHRHGRIIRENSIIGRARKAIDACWSLVIGIEGRWILAEEGRF